jgi:hypothetical protein
MWKSALCYSCACCFYLAIFIPPTAFGEGFICVVFPTTPKRRPTIERNTGRQATTKTTERMREVERERERERESPLPQLGCARRRHTAHVWQTSCRWNAGRQATKTTERKRESPAAKPQRRQRERERAHCLTKASVRHRQAEKTTERMRERERERESTASTWLRQTPPHRACMADQSCRWNAGRQATKTTERKRERARPPSHKDDREKEREPTASRRLPSDTPAPCLS